MPIPTPPVLPQPFANNADPSFITAIPDTTITAARASYDLGFPPVTMQPEASGGIPPFGQDFNGIFYALSAHVFAQQAGQLYTYNSDVSTAAGGYPLGAMIESSDGTTVWFNIVANNTADPDAEGAGWVPMFNYGYTAKTGVTGGVVTLTREEARRGVIVLTGVLVANLQVVLPNTLQNWLIVNATTGAFDTTVKTAAGSGVTVSQGGYGAPTGVYGNGTNIYPTVAPLGVAIDQAPTPLTIAQRTNAGYLLATYFNQNSAVENPSVGSILVQNVAADGFLRKISILNFEAQLILSNIGGQVANAQVPQSAVTQHSVALFLNAALTGAPTAPTGALTANTTQIANTAYVQANTVGGIGQTWQTVGRSFDVAYTNTTGRPIQLNVEVSVGTNSSVNMYVGTSVPGLIQVGRIAASAADVHATMSAVIPAGHVYLVSHNYGTVNGIIFSELRD
jgi:hypothetical protein